MKTLGLAMSLFFLDRGSGSLGAVFVGSLGTFLPVPLAVAASALACGLGTWLEDLRVPPSNRLEKLSGDRRGQ